MGVISLRLEDRDLERLDELSKALRDDKSTMARELLEYGWDFLMLEYCKERKLTGPAKKLDVSVSETLDLLKQRGIESPIGFDDDLKGFEVFDQVK